MNYQQNTLYPKLSVTNDYHILETENNNLKKENDVLKELVEELRFKIDMLKEEVRRYKW